MVISLFIRLVTSLKQFLVYKICVQLDLWHFLIHHRTKIPLYTTVLGINWFAFPSASVVTNLSGENTSSYLSEFSSFEHNTTSDWLVKTNG